MAYVPGFKWDIFISYPMEAEAWTKRFAQDLVDGTELPAAIGSRIYFAGKDWALGGTSDDMLDAARNAALFVAVLTKDSLGEEHKRFLRQEMEAFQKSGPVKGRFCPLPLYPVDASQLKMVMPTDNPDAFWNTNMNFFYKDGDDIPLRLKPDSEPQPGAYGKKVEKVAHQLRDLLDKLQVSRSAEVRINEHGPFSGKTVFLAPRDPESCIPEQEWQSIKKLLLDDGAKVLPEAPTAEAERAAVARCELFVQLFTASDLLDTARRQLNLAQTAKAAGQRLPVLQWRKKLRAESLEGLAAPDREFCEGADVRTGLLEEFKIAIREELSKPPPPPPPGEDDKPYLYIAADTPDLALAGELQEAARKRTVADVMTRDETQRLKDFEDGVTHASGVVFLIGNTEVAFVEGWLKVFIRNAALAKLRSKFKNRTWLYRAPPPEKPKKVNSPIDLREEGSEKVFAIEGIERICAELCRASG
jgi:hypothetical protein